MSAITPPPTAGGSPQQALQHFTEFDTALSIEYDGIASSVLGKDYWRVLTGFKFYLGQREEEKWITIPAGYLTDGTTVPRIFWSLLPPWGIYGQAAVVHDFLCERLTVSVHGIEASITRAQADKAFKDAMVALNVPRWKRNVMYIAVRIYAKFTGVNKPAINGKKAKYEADWAAAHPNA